MTEAADPGKATPPPVPDGGKAAEAPAAPPASPSLSSPTESAPNEWETRFKYLLADFENFRKRVDRERESVRLGAEAEVLRGLLPIYEAFEHARVYVRRAPAADPVRQGMELLAQAWEGFLVKEGLRTIAHVGSRVNSEDYEVIGEGLAPKGQAPGTVLEVVQQGYRFKGGLLRPAKVLVAKSPPTPPEAAGRTDPPAAAASEEGSAR